MHRDLKEPIVNLTLADLGFEDFENLCQSLFLNQFVDLDDALPQAQCPKQVVGHGNLQVKDQHIFGFLNPQVTAEPKVLCRPTRLRVFEGLDGKD